MRVGLIIYDSINITTGGYIYDYKLVEYLRSRGVLVKIFSQRKNFLHVMRNNFSRKIINEIIDFSPDVLLQDEMNFSALLFLNKELRKRGNFPIISIVHLLQANMQQNYLKKWIIKKMETFYLKSVDGFIFNSISTEQSITKIIGKTESSLIAYPGKDRLQLQVLENHIEFKCQDNRKLMVIFIGNLLHNKGLHVLLHALSQIDYDSWHLSIVGNPHLDLRYTRKILKRIASLKLENNIKVYGLLDIETLKKELLLQHVLIVPSYFESYGIVYAEAMGAGLPIIASNIGGVPEIVTDAMNGFLITPGDSAMLRDYIIQLIKNRNLLRKMSFSSLSAYQNLPSWDDSMIKIYDFISTLNKR